MNYSAPETLITTDSVFARRAIVASGNGARAESVGDSLSGIKRDVSFERSFLRLNCGLTSGVLALATIGGHAFQDEIRERERNEMIVFKSKSAKSKKKKRSATETWSFSSSTTSKRQRSGTFYSRRYRRRFLSVSGN